KQNVIVGHVAGPDIVDKDLPSVLVYLRVWGRLCEAYRHRESLYLYADDNSLIKRDCNFFMAQQRQPCGSRGE
ncbi:MAG: hypothetical protein JAY68_17930, partial [Candidatus Thiodiazotropha taylori]|nr:hypothetical protein [Candidatus Thiodiazotropha taylori]